MTDLPPRFSRKLKKADKYLEANAMKQSTDAVIMEEDEEEVAAAAATSRGVGELYGVTRSGVVTDREKEKSKTKENTVL